MSELLRDVARTLKYRELPDAIGQRILIPALGDLLRSLSTLAHHVVPDCELDADADELSALTGTIAKFGIMHVTFMCRSALLDDVDTNGMRTLQTLGYVDTDVNDLTFDDDPDFCLRRLKAEISAKQPHLLLALRVTNSTEFDGDFISRIRWLKRPELIPFPLEFEVVDACLTNAPNVWFFKHDYGFYYMLNTY